MALPADDSGHGASQPPWRAPALQRRAIARRFSCPHDPNWTRVTRVLIAAGVAAALVTLMLQIDAPSWVVAVLPLAVLLADLRKPVQRIDTVLRWDGLQW